MAIKIKLLGWCQVLGIFLSQLFLVMLEVINEYIIILKYT